MTETLIDFEVPIKKKHWLIQQPFQNFSRNRNEKDCAIILYQLFIIFCMGWSNMYFFNIREYPFIKRRPNCKTRSSHPTVFLGKGVLKICSKFTREHPCRSAISIKLLKQLNWNHTSAWVFSYKFAAYFQNKFS